MPATRWRVFLLLAVFLIPAAPSPLSFNITPITFTDRSSFNFSGAALVDGGIRITPNENGTRGRATHSEPLHLWDKSSGSLTDFTTHFSFIIDSNGNPYYGDGMAFFLAPLDSTLQNSSSGDGLGLGGGGGGSSSTFVAVELDTYLNDFDPPFPDRMEMGFYPHIGIDINTMRSSNYTTWRNEITKGFQSDAWISYNATTMMLTVEFTGRNGSITQRGSLGYEVDLRVYLPEFVAVGFSAATGTFSELHVVKSWSFSSTSLQLNHVRLNKENKSKGLIYGLSVGLSLLVVLILGSGFAIFFVMKRKTKTKTEVEKEKG